jgi:hypothetical protein
VYGWVQDVAEDFSSAQPQTNITAVEGQDIRLNIFFTKNGFRNTLLFHFNVETSGTAIEGVDYTLAHSQPLIIRGNPTPVTVSLLNDRVMEEGVETICLTLMQDTDTTPFNENEFLLYDTVTISVQDNSLITGFAMSAVTVTEGSEAEVCLTTVGVPGSDTTVRVAVVPGTAEDKDLDLVTSEVVITAGDREPCVKFSAVAGDPLDLEPLEMLSLSLSAPPNVQLETPSLSVFIQDGSKQSLLCSKEADCSEPFISETVDDCCGVESGLTYQNSSGTCTECDGLKQSLLCSKEADCSEPFISETVDDCCGMESGLTYQNSSGTCTECDGLKQSLLCSKEADCSEPFISETVDDCCGVESGLTSG